MLYWVIGWCILTWGGISKKWCSRQWLIIFHHWPLFPLLRIFYTKKDRAVNKFHLTPKALSPCSNAKLYFQDIDAITLQPKLSDVLYLSFWNQSHHSHLREQKIKNQPVLLNPLSHDTTMGSLLTRWRWLLKGLGFTTISPWTLEGSREATVSATSILVAQQVAVLQENTDFLVLGTW